MTKLVFASQNEHKIKEIRDKVPMINVVGLDPQVFPQELKEEGDTLEANAIQKVEQVYAVLKENCFADDTGLEIKALNNEPGVLSARYAGDAKDSTANMAKVLENLKNKENRSAQFRTVIALKWDGEMYLFEGVCRGHIIESARGDQGFGYDPIFVPEGYDTTFAEMELVEKNKISHRALAVQKLVQFLNDKF